MRDNLKPLDEQLTAGEVLDVRLEGLDGKPIDDEAMELLEVIPE